MNVEIQPYFAEGERYPALIGVRIEGDEYETAYVSKGELVDALDENAKMRELVRDMHKALFSLNLDHCQACPREDACVFVHKSFDCDECAFERDMRELEIEVDDD